MQGDNGPFIMFKRTFNPAGMPNDGRDNVLLSCFEPRQQDGASNGGQRQDSGSRYQSGYDAQKPHGGAQAGGYPDLDDSLPF